ncbi:MAG: DNA-formamidopyrimidine glycosylase [Acholeplasmataceae bacterium]|nr:DNA-formamidopyrimidine glycosylase [Acholeplasmataceae bacterium]
MPELPEVETVRRTLELAIGNEEIVEVVENYSKIITNDIFEFKKSIQNQKIHRIDRMGKYLIFILDTHTMIIHLRMEGKFFIKTNEPVLKHEHIVFKFKSGRELRYHDVRKFGTITLLPLETYLESYPLNKLALEPKDINIHKFFEVLQKKRIEIKAVLLDQHIVSGLGNIYVDETLFLSKIHPTRLANTISLDEAAKIIKSAIQVLDKATALGGTTIRSYTSSLGVHGRFQNELNVHMRKDLPCPICQTKIIKMKIKGRGTYVCPSCQD